MFCLPVRIVLRDFSFRGTRGPNRALHSPVFQRSDAGSEINQPTSTRVFSPSPAPSWWATQSGQLHVTFSRDLDDRDRGGVNVQWSEIFVPMHSTLSLCAHPVFPSAEVP
eukprot:1610191-Prymnesium_polylepis.1